MTFVYVVVAVVLIGVFAGVWVLTDRKRSQREATDTERIQPDSAEHPNMTRGDAPDEPGR